MWDPQSKKVIRSSSVTFPQRPLVTGRVPHQAQGTREAHSDERLHIQEEEETDYLGGVQNLGDAQPPTPPQTLLQDLIVDLPEQGRGYDFRQEQQEMDEQQSDENNPPPPPPPPPAKRPRGRPRRTAAPLAEPTRQSSRHAPRQLDPNMVSTVDNSERRSSLTSLTRVYG